MSDDNNENKRPNAKYKLSNENPNVYREVVHHYSRERRLEKAPQAVRDMYKEQPRRRLGFMYTLVGTKPNAMLFGTILFLCALMLLLSFFGVTGDSHELDGNIIAIQGKKYDGMSIIEVKKTPKKNIIGRRVKTYTGPVNIAVFPPAKSGSPQNQPATDIYYNRIFFTGEQEERYSFTVPFAQDELALVFQTETKTVSFTFKPAAPKQNQ